MSLNSKRPGTLSIVGTPLGNAEDLTPRARRCLEEADAVLAEDTRRAGLACARWGVTARRFVSLHDHNEERRKNAVLDALRDGRNLALISDAGMPVLADPGFLLVRPAGTRGCPSPCCRCLRPRHRPGRAAASPRNPLFFSDFCPAGERTRRRRSRPTPVFPATLVFFERRDRLTDTLENALRLLGPREGCVARELTKTHEEYIRFHLDESGAYRALLTDVLGEVTVILGPPKPWRKARARKWNALITEELPRGGTPRELARRVQARAHGWTGGEIYSMLPKLRPGD